MFALLCTALGAPQGEGRTAGQVLVFEYGGDKTQLREDGRQGVAAASTKLMKKGRPGHNQRRP